jgi:hypothetical protein
MSNHRRAIALNGEIVGHVKGEAWELLSDDDKSRLAMLQGMHISGFGLARMRDALKLATSLKPYESCGVIQTAIMDVRENGVEPK